MHTRSLNVLSIPPLQTFSLEPPAILLPSSVAQLPPAQPALSRPSFFEPNQPQPPQQQATVIVPPPLQQTTPGYVPLTGTANYFFQPYLERDEKLGVCMFQSMNIRPEMSQKSPEELRLEDYNNGGVSQYVAPQVALPGAVDMGLRGLVPSASAFSAFTTPAPVASSSAFGSISASPSAFGTNTVGIFPTTQPSAFSAFASQPVTQPSAFSAFGSQSTIPQWGTATAGFGFPSTTSAWPQQQPSNVFGTLTNTTFQFPAAPAAPFTSFSFTNTPFQIPTQAQFFWSTSPIETFAQFLKTLPPTVSSCSFGGVQVTAPTIEECAAKIKEEKTRIAKPDADPFDLAHSLLPPPVFALEPPVVPEVTAVPASQGGSPLKRGTSSPVLSTPTRSPLVLPQSGLHARGSSLAVPALGLGAPAISASLGTSPRLCPLPASPYLESRELSAVSVGRSVSHQSTPTKSLSSHQHSYSLHQMLHGVQASPRPHHHQPSLSSSAILFSSQQETQSSPSRQLTTPEHHHSIVGRRLDLSGLHEVH